MTTAQNILVMLCLHWHSFHSTQGSKLPGRECFVPVQLLIKMNGFKQKAVYFMANSDCLRSANIGVRQIFTFQRVKRLPVGEYLDGHLIRTCLIASGCKEPTYRSFSLSPCTHLGGIWNNQGLLRNGDVRFTFRFLDSEAKLLPLYLYLIQISEPTRRRGIS